MTAQKAGQTGGSRRSAADQLKVIVDSTVARWDLVVASAVTAGAVWMLWLIGGDGAGVTPDAVAYLSAARSILAGEGARVMFGGEPGGLISHWPPGYPHLLAGYMAVLGEQQAALGVNMTALTISGLSAATAVRTVAGPGPAVPVAAAAVTLTPTIMGAHTWMLTEATFLSLTLLAAALTVHATRPDRTFRQTAAAALAAGTVAGLSTTVRYAGIAVVAAVAASLLTSSNMPGVKRKAAMAAISLAAAVPAAAWALTYGGSARSTISWHPPTAGDWQNMLRTAGRWLIPAGSAPRPALWAAVAALLAILLAAGRTSGARQPVIVLMPASLLAVTVLSRTTVDPAIPFDSRILLPAQGTMILAAAVAAGRAGRLQTLSVVALAAVVASAALLAPARAGAGYRDQQNHPIIIWAGETEGQVWSNSAAFVHLHTGLPVRPLPQKVDAAGRPEAEFESHLGQVCGEGALVYQYPPSVPSHRRMPTVEELTGYGFEVVDEQPGGHLLRLPACTSP